MNSSTIETTRRKNRRLFLIIVALFIGPMLIALGLNLAGWRPTKTKSYGTLVDPPRDMSAASVTLADGGKFLWRNPQWQWTLLALPGASCAQHCQAAVADVLRMRATLGRNATRLRVLYLGPALSPQPLTELAPLQPGVDASNAFAAWRATGDDTLALALVDPNGYLMMRYPDGFDVAGVRGDLPKVIN